MDFWAMGGGGLQPSYIIAVPGIPDAGTVRYCSSRAAGYLGEPIRWVGERAREGGREMRWVPGYDAAPVFVSTIIRVLSE